MFLNSLAVSGKTTSFQMENSIQGEKKAATPVVKGLTFRTFLCFSPMTRLAQTQMKVAFTFRMATKNKTKTNRWTSNETQTLAK